MNSPYSEMWPKPKVMKFEIVEVVKGQRGFRVWYWLIPEKHILINSSLKIHPWLNSTLNQFILALIHSLIYSTMKNLSQVWFILAFIHPLIYQIMKNLSLVWFILALIPPRSDSFSPWFLPSLIHLCLDSSSN